MNLLNEFNRQFIIPVIRETDAATLESMSLAMADGGLRILEITLMSETVVHTIKKLSSRANLIVGAGTVLTVAQARAAIEAGAKFLVSPGLNEDIFAVANEAGVLFYPGVLTPTEVMRAKAKGCQFMKVFPISAVGGPAYLHALRGPFPDLKWMPTGGVSLQNLKSFVTAGAHCVGMGGQLIPADVVTSKNWNALTKIAADHVQALEGERR